MKGQAIAYRLESFEGPLDLLLHLISKNKVSVYDIPIAQILEQYLEHIRRMRELDMDVASEFIAMAAQLMYIKSKMLLPARQEEEAQPDPRAPLVEALLEYQRFKRAGELLQQREELGRDLYAKPPESREASQVQYAYTAQALGRAVQNILERYDRKAPPPAGLFRGVAGAALWDCWPIVGKSALNRWCWNPAVARKLCRCFWRCWSCSKSAKSLCWIDKGNT